jgi:hypothetical protein
MTCRARLVSSVPARSCSSYSCVLERVAGTVSVVDELIGHICGGTARA